MNEEKKESWLYRFYNAWYAQCSILLQKEGREAYEELEKTLNIEQRFDPSEIQGLLSMGMYWKEVSEREEFPEIIMTAELNQLVRHIGAERILMTFLDAVKLQKAIYP